MAASYAKPAVALLGGLPSPFGSATRIRAVLFDLDGTLYDQPRLRRLMAWELAVGLLSQPFSAARRLRGLREFRKAQESLRHGTRTPGALDLAQLELAASRAALPADELASLVREWMEERPLKHLPRCGFNGLRELFEYLAGCGVAVGVFSDYPPHAKLRALGVADSCSLVLCASDPDIGAFKPDPRGFLVACERWGLPPQEVLMVGDRTEVDGAGAAAAGMPCVILGQEVSPSHNGTNLLMVASLERLRRVLDGNH